MLRLAVLAAFVIGTGASCANQMGKNASEGFVRGLEQGRDRPPEEQVTRMISQRAVAGAFEALEEPKQQEAMRQMIAAAVAQATASTVAALNDPQQRQQLAQLMSSVVDEAVSTGFESSRAATSGAGGPAVLLAGDIARAAAKGAMAEVTAGLGGNMDQLFPGCTGTDVAACRRQHLRALTREAGAGFSAGVLDSIKWFALLAAAFVGMLIGLFVHWLWTLRPHHPAGPLVSINGGRGLREAHGTRSP